MSANDSDKWAPVVKRLINKTNDGEIDWESDPDVARQRDDVVGHAYSAIVKDRRIAVYEYRFKFYTDADEFHWDSDVAIEFVDGEGNLLWRFPETPIRWNLLEAVRFYTAAGSEFLDEFMREEE